MNRVSERPLPGVGTKYTFPTEEGRALGVVVHHTGWRELMVYDTDDPDSCRTNLRLSDADARTLTDLLGGDEVARSLEATQESLPGLTIDWLPVTSSLACEGRSIGALWHSSESNTMIVAVVRDQQTYRTPGPDFELENGDTVVAVGTTEGVAEMFSKLQEGPVGAS